MENGTIILITTLLHQRDDVRPLLSTDDAGIEVQVDMALGQDREVVDSDADLTEKFRNYIQSKICVLVTVNTLYL